MADCAKQGPTVSHVLNQLFLPKVIILGDKSTQFKENAFFPFIWMKQLGTEEWSDLPNVTQSVSGRAGSQSRALRPRSRPALPKPPTSVPFGSKQPSWGSDLPSHGMFELYNCEFMILFSLVMNSKITDFVDNYWLSTPLKGILQ